MMQGKKPKPKRYAASAKAHTKPALFARFTRQSGGEARAMAVWKNLWAVVGPLIALVGFYFLLRPQISIEPGANLDPSKPFGTLFLVKNTGHIPIYDVQFTCRFGMGHMYASAMTGFWTRFQRFSPEPRPLVAA
jgi:hypothetical protein